MMDLSRRDMITGGSVMAISISTRGRASLAIADIRAATVGDRAGITSLLLQDVKIRKRLNAGLWSVAPDAERRIEASLDRIANPQNGPVIHHWLVAERGGTVIGVTHAVNLPPPPVYDGCGDTAGVILDDSHFGEDGAVSARLLAETERTLLEAGAGLTVAVSPVNWRKRTNFLKAAGYEPTTSFLTKTGLKATEKNALFRKAASDDLPEIIRLSALHRARLAIANPDFWRTHPDADARFGAWMIKSLTLRDRAMFVSGTALRLSGYIIAQPAAQVNLPPGHDLSKIGFIDDFWSDDFGSSKDRRAEEQAVALLSAAEAYFHDNGIDTSLVVSPVKIAEKLEFLKRHGYEEANQWLVKKKPTIEGT